MPTDNHNELPTSGVSVISGDPGDLDDSEYLCSGNRAMVDFVPLNGRLLYGSPRVRRTRLLPGR